MKRIFALLILALAVSASRPLICWTVKMTNSGPEIRQVYGSNCYSTEFDGKQDPPAPTPEPTEIPWPTETPDLPLPYDTPTPTDIEPYPAPTSTMPVYPWGGFEP